VLIIKMLLLVTLLIIGIQDFKERMIYWFLPVLVLLYGSFLFYDVVLIEQFWIAVGFNFCFILFLLLSIYLYSRYKLKVSLKEALGLGDILLFLALACSMNTVSFIITLIFSLIFSLSMHLVFKKKSTFNTVPLAGYISLFYIFVFLAQWLNLMDSIYYI